jgi:membrane protein implicated in regulation of membrane protease activity
MAGGTPMTGILSNPVQVVGWLLILLLAAVLAILLMTRTSPGKQQNEPVSEGVLREEEGHVVEGTLAQDKKEGDS